MVVALFCALKFCKTEKQKTIALKSTAVLLLTAALIHRILLAFHPNSAPYGGWNYLIPSSFCSITSVVFPIAVLLCKDRNHPIFHCVMYISFLGGVITIFYPDWLFRDGMWHPGTLIALIHHTISLYLFFLMLMLGGWRPSLKKWHYAYIGLAFYILTGYFLLEIMGNYAAVGMFFEITDTVYMIYEEGYGYVIVDYYVEGATAVEITLTRGRPIVLDWHWAFPAPIIFGTYHFGFMGIYEYMHRKSCAKCAAQEGGICEPDGCVIKSEGNCVKIESADAVFADKNGTSLAESSIETIEQQTTEKAGPLSRPRKAKKVETSVG